MITSRPERLDRGKALPGESRDVDRFAIFAFLWASAHLFQLSSVLQWFVNLAPLTWVGVTETLIAGTALGVILRPVSRTRLWMLAGAQITATIVALPHIPNHRLLTTFVNVVIFGALGPAIYTGERVSLERFAPPLRAITILLYAFAVLAKINRDFLDPAVSCASEFYRDILGVLPFLPMGWVEWAPVASVGVEAAVPPLLIWRRTRHLGILVAGSFHLFLTLHPERHFFDFSSTMFALLFLFVSWDIVRAVSKPGIFPSYRAVVVTFTSGLAVVWVAGLVYQHRAAFAVFLVARYAVWFPWALVLLGLFLVALRERRTGLSWQPDFWRVRTSSGWIVIALVLINGFLPYIGLKTRSSFDMYSNLEVEGPNSNHLIFPPWLDVFSYQSDLVEILDSSDPNLLATYTEAGYAMTFFEFRSYVASHPEEAVTYRREELVRSVASAPGGVTPPNPLLRKLLWFRPVDLSPTARCQW